MSAYIFNFNECQDLSIIEIGKQKCTPLYSFGPFIRNEYIFHYILTGKGYCSHGHSSDYGCAYRKSEPKGGPPQFEIRAGEGFLIEPHTKHIYNADSKEPWYYIWVVFKGLSAPQYLRECGFSKNNSVYRPKDYSIQTLQKIKEHLLAILEHPNSSRAFVLGHFHLFFAALADNASTACVKESSQDFLPNFYLSEAIRYINMHYQNIRSLEEIAVFCNVSKSHLSRLFRERLHTSLQEYLIQFRLNKAKELLVNTSLPICEIAVQVGYQSEINLLRAFKNKYGIPPNAYRKKHSL